MGFIFYLSNIYSYIYSVFICICLSYPTLSDMLNANQNSVGHYHFITFKLLYYFQDIFLYIFYVIFILTLLLCAIYSWICNGVNKQFTHRTDQESRKRIIRNLAKQQQKTAFTHVSKLIFHTTWWMHLSFDFCDSEWLLLLVILHQVHDKEEMPSLPRAWSLIWKVSYLRMKHCLQSQQETLPGCSLSHLLIINSNYFFYFNENLHPV